MTAKCNSRAPHPKKARKRHGAEGLRRFEPCGRIRLHGRCCRLSCSCCGGGLVDGIGMEREQTTPCEGGQFVQTYLRISFGFLHTKLVCPAFWFFVAPQAARYVLLKFSSTESSGCRCLWTGHHEKSTNCVVILPASESAQAFASTRAGLTGNHWRER